MSENEEKLSLIGHIGELRKRLIRSVIVVLIATIVGFVFWRPLLELLKYPTPDIVLSTIEFTEGIGSAMRIAITAGIIVSIPWLTYELIMFVSPALTRREKKYVYIILPWIALMFIAGVAFCYFIIMPRMVEFLYLFSADVANPLPRLKDFISLTSRLLLIVGLMFEMPVVTTFLARIGVLKPEWLSGGWRIAVVAAFILAAFITPTIDPINQCLVAAPMLVLYVMCIWLAKLVYKKKETAEEQDPSLD
ncbi:twin-arginine translocase subunit TatC [Chloroflexota bacterium]